jgi:hypothetical protein
MTRLLILGACLVACATLLPSAASAQSIACAAQVPAPPKGHWYYRIIDGRKCWYEGKAMIPKSSLYWPKSDVADTEVRKPVLASDAPRATTDGRNVARQPAAEPAAAQTPDPDVWPAPVVDDGSFESRWRALYTGR